MYQIFNSHRFLTHFLPEKWPSFFRKIPGFFPANSWEAMKGASIELDVISYSAVSQRKAPGGCGLF